jgi:hypothetical protein
MSKYIASAKGNKRLALKLYQWNTALAQCLYYPIQSFEIAYRNAFAGYLAGRYGVGWPYNATLRDQLIEAPRNMLLDAVDRQIKERRSAKPSTDQIVADLSLGFWASLITKKHVVPLRLTKGIVDVFPHLPPKLGWHEAGQAVAAARALRNKVAHHEPVFHLQNLPDQLTRLIETTGWLCPTTAWHVEMRTSFQERWSKKPQ